MNKFRLPRQVIHWLDIARSLDSLPEELDESWESWVAHPIVTHILAPQQARASLEIIGELADRGYNVSDMLESMAVHMLANRMTEAGKTGSVAGRKLKNELRPPKTDRLIRIQKD